MNDFTTDGGVPIEHFIQALTSQLDRAQAALALKARAGLPLTFAVKDLTLDLRAHLEMVGSVVHIRPAGPNEHDASTLRLQLTTVTRPMIEENAMPLSTATDEPSLRDVLGPEIGEEDRRRLEWAGIHNIAQLRDVQRRGGEDALEKYTQVPVARLRAALTRASAPRIVRVLPEPAPSPRPGGDDVRPPVEPGPIFRGERVPDLLKRIPDLTLKPRTNGPSIVSPTPPAVAPTAPVSPVTTPPLLRIRGINLVGATQPKVTIGGEAMPVLRANEREIVIAPPTRILSGTLAVEVAPGVTAETELNLPATESAPRTAVKEEPKS